MDPSNTPLLDQIAAHGNRGHHHGWLRVDNLISCWDGTTISVIAGNGTLSLPRPVPCSCYGNPDAEPTAGDDGFVECDYPGPYSWVEVFTDHPELTGGDRGQQAISVEVESLRAWIVSHGGEFSMLDAAEYILLTAEPSES